ncbi:hypothetical protein Tco_0952693 [Tanacetum coccineum]|uniref:Uncharacterized protein n=1 Tax=Tanacetum coccineum TaxID=301880 RepID=A0ABQ5E0L3_9ASTR
MLRGSCCDGVLGAGGGDVGGGWGPCGELVRWTVGSGTRRSGGEVGVRLSEGAVGGRRLRGLRCGVEFWCFRVLLGLGHLGVKVCKGWGVLELVTHCPLEVVSSIYLESRQLRKNRIVSDEQKANPSEAFTRLIFLLSYVMCLYNHVHLVYDGDDDKELFPDEVKRIQQILKRTSFDAITPDFSITDSLSMGDRAS